ncbi:1-deoxy-D-xylulose 5-phosphate reductoisomerase [Geomicrobium sp. JCM 19037]|uniref:1-deoxy-D-xylulose-5-phosphate reductoisomerase n=1 Tax=Geomicrobium sp. JCM 19037 TaxID=1460634 RepID=UPI00045F4C82|nr:1-deoxy-D-xylulose-5-phosphate reductoisomerase [Geomicrobium sp. JCM 19037]GAK02024.1 1-deoxy-D-xylulose 5-phosphate reductoisomerase [Geomicrobium sp. JCM 19037]
MKKIAVIGSTGSIGTQTLDVIREHPDQFTVHTLACGRNIDLLKQQIAAFEPEVVIIGRVEDLPKLKGHLGHARAYAGEEALVEAVAHSDVDFVMNAMVGARGLLPTMAAAKVGKKIGIANKETLVTAGHLVTETCRKYGAELIAVDSEHSAILQSLQGNKLSEVERIIVTASGGSFRDWSYEQLKTATPSDALKHPNWSMGQKVTIDSATMMNKGLEVIEAHWLFGLPYEKIDVVIHRESIIHSLVEYIDKSVIAQLGSPDMKVAIQYALTYPNRLELGGTERLNLLEVGKLHFEAYDQNKHRCLDLSIGAGKAGGSMPTVLNAANEVAVELFLQEKVSFLGIADIVEKALETHDKISQPSIEDVLAVDEETRKRVRAL